MPHKFHLYLNYILSYFLCFFTLITLITNEKLMMTSFNLMMFINKLIGIIKKQFSVQLIDIKFIDLSWFWYGMVLTVGSVGLADDCLGLAS